MMIAPDGASEIRQQWLVQSGAAFLDDGHYRQQMTRVLDDLHANYPRRRSVASIARHHGMSESVLQTRFRACTGRAIHEYTTVVRVCHAVLALATTDAKVALIAGSVGYASRKDFYRMLRRHAAVTPTDVRRLPPRARLTFALSLAKTLVPAMPIRI
jgi:transcriptional regulator GlxA family with amidase domain